MEDTLRSPRELIAERVVCTPADHAQIALCRGDHNRLGFAYQMAFLRLTDRLVVYLLAADNCPTPKTR
jgi:hypothetical protein